MSTYYVDSERQKMTATGIVTPVMEWIETADGRRRPGDLQLRHEDTGMRLWQVEVTYRAEVFGREHTVTAGVTVGAEQEPSPEVYSPIVFDVLKVEARVNKAGGWVERWEAESIKRLVPTAAKPATQKPGDKAVA